MASAVDLSQPPLWQLGADLEGTVGEEARRALEAQHGLLICPA